MSTVTILPTAPMTDNAAYLLARQNDPRCIPHLMRMLTHAATEILRLECRIEDLERAPYEFTLQELLKTLFPVASDRDASRFARKLRKRGMREVARAVARSVEWNHLAIEESIKNTEELCETEASTS